MIGDVTAAATRCDLHNAYELVRHTGGLLTMITGEKNLTAFQRTDVADKLHRTRNVIGALLAAAVSDSEHHLSAVADALPKLQMRTRHSSRPLVHDEVLLTNLDMWATSRQGADGRRAAGVYALCHTGAVPGETTTVALDSFDDPRDPLTVLLPGNSRIAMRILDLDGYARSLLRALTDDAYDRGVDARTPLTYRPRKNAPGSYAATASAQGVIDRMLKGWGLFHDDVTAYWLPLWRVATVYAEHGIEAACEVSGRPADATLRLIKTTTATETSFTPTVLDFDE